MSLLFCWVNLKGMLALFSGVSRCCVVDSQSVSILPLSAPTSFGVDMLTTARVSEATLDVTAKDRHRVREAIYNGRKADRNTEGASLDAIITKMGRNGFQQLEVLSRRHFRGFR
jgi:hypothetical protein